MAPSPRRMLEGPRAARRTRSPRDNVITFSELNRYVGERVKELTANRQHPVLHSIQPSRDLPLAVATH